MFAFVALETLSRLCQMELNEEAICCQLDDAIYEHLIRLLTIQDLQLIVSALETIYQLSEIGTVTSNRIAQVSASVGQSWSSFSIDRERNDRFDWLCNVTEFLYSAPSR